MGDIPSHATISQDDASEQAAGGTAVDTYTVDLSEIADGLPICSRDSIPR